jgi:glycerate 2-kinase
MGSELTDIMKKTNTSLKTIRQDAIDIFKAGIKAVAPAEAIARFCGRQKDILAVGTRTFDLAAYGQVFVVGAGKATAPMAAALETLLGGHLTAGLISVKYDHTAPLRKVQTIEAGHPVPDANGERAAGRILALARQAGPNDLVICLLSGGGSALLPKPVDGVSLADKQVTTSVLLACGATIHEINALRKHLSVIKGGQLALAAHPATMATLILSDVVGDDLDVIASGPTVSDNSTFSDCMAIVAKYNISSKLPPPVSAYLERGHQGRVPETPKAHDPAFANTFNTIIGSNMDALLAAHQEAVARGYTTQILSSMIEGETGAVARVHGAIAREIIKTGHPVAPPACILSGGETTVTLKGSGLGGRNQEFALCTAAGIAGRAPVLVLSGGTDGNDGPTDAAGAIVDNTTLKRAVEQGLDWTQFLANNDAYHFFEPLGDLLITGPTNTNVMDLRIMLVPA